MGFAYGSDNRWHDQYFDREKAVNTADIACEAALAVGAHRGALAVTVAANGPVSVASGKALVLTVQGCDTEDGEFSDVPGAPEVSVKGGSSAAASFEDGEVLCTLVLPDMQRYAKIRLTSDAANSGSVDVYLACLAR